MNITPKEQPLLVEVKNGLLVISVGIETLKVCQQIVIDNEDYDKKETSLITDPKQFAEDLVSELRDEREDGSSILTDLLDLASRQALDNGSVSQKFVKKKPYTYRKGSNL